MGSFRLAAGRGYLHPQCNFAESLVETVRMLLCHSCRSELTRQGISLSHSRRLRQDWTLPWFDLGSSGLPGAESLRALLPSDVPSARRAGEHGETSRSLAAFPS